MKTFALPDLGEGLQEAQLVQWHVQAGDLVEADQPLLSVETAKAVVEIPAPYSGRIVRLFGVAGDTVPTGAPLLSIDTVRPDEDAGTVVGSVTTGTHDGGGRPQPDKHAAIPARAPDAVRALPAVRRLARNLGVDLAGVTPTGRDGVITQADVQHAASGTAATPQPLSGLRRSMAQAMSLARQEVAAATLVDDADIHAWPPHADITSRLIRSLVAGCRAEGALNAWFDSGSMARRLLASIDVGLAVDLPEGLLVAVLRDAAAHDAHTMRQALDNLRARAAARTLLPDELRGQSITLSNFGMLGGRYSAPIVVPPTVAILGAGRARDQVVAVDGMPAVHRLLPLSLSFDHRVVTGGEAARFLAAVMGDLAKAD